MQTAAIQPRLDASTMPLEKLAGNANIPEAEKVGELGRQFEAVLLRKILGEAQKTVFKSRFQTESFAGDVYRDMITHQMAECISQSGSVGLGPQIAAQLSRQAALAPPPHSHD